MFRTVSLRHKHIPKTCYRAESTRGKLFIDYKFGSKERTELQETLRKLANADNGVPIVIGNDNIFTGDEQFLRMPQNHQRILAKYSYSNSAQINKAIKTATEMRDTWRKVPVGERIKIWNSCADVIEKEERYNLNAAIMLGHAKTFMDAEVDTSRLVVALRKNAEYLQWLSQQKPTFKTSSTIFPTLHLRPLDGFVAAFGPFNQTHVCANMAFCPALMGNCVLWKPSKFSSLSSYIVYKAMMKAGLPRGVISFMPSNSKLFLNTISQSPELAGINFTGKVRTYQHIFHQTAIHMNKYRSLPRLVGECGGKNFHFVHESANLELVAKATIRGAFEYSGQKCTCCSRIYVPESMWPDLSCILEEKCSTLKINDPCDFGTFASAVISEKSFDRIVRYLTYADQKHNVEIVCGGDFCKTLGYFVEPTVVACKDPTDKLLADEICGPVLAVYVYKNNNVDDALKIINRTSKFAYTGAIFATDDKVICNAVKALRMCASNLYINESCVGRVDGHFPLGGSRWSGTNDYTGSPGFLTRWSQPLLIEESFPSGGAETATDRTC